GSRLLPHWQRTAITPCLSDILFAPMQVKNCVGSEFIPFPGACRGGCSLGWRWSDMLLIAATVALFFYH
ncbi:MAG: hypothetical protein IKB25_13460, partial [Lentisphaeria bacterium]|nr:hypothetical protein [Lentisphaeria bacterium]